MIIRPTSINSNRRANEWKFGGGGRPNGNTFIPSSEDFLNTATFGNIQSKSRLFDAASVVFGLFIGYLC